MRASIPTLTILALAPYAPAATVIDWFSLSGTDWLDGSSASVATTSLSATTGTPSGAHPVSHFYNGSYWDQPGDFEDSVTANDSLPAFDYLVHPGAGGFDYTLTFSLSDLTNGILAVGNLSPLSGTSVEILAMDAGMAPLTIVNLASTRSWDGGFVPLDGLFDWNSTSGVLSPQATTGNETGMAWFEIPSGTAGLQLRISGSSALPPGDTVSLALGKVVPEPTLASLLLIAGVASIAGRRRC